MFYKCCCPALVPRIRRGLDSRGRAPHCGRLDVGAGRIGGASRPRRARHARPAFRAFPSRKRCAGCPLAKSGVIRPLGVEMAEDRRFAPPRAALAPAGAAFGSSGMAGHVVVVGDLKGGSGKSPLVITLASALAEAGRRVAILDCDPQGTASAWASRGHAAVPVRFEPLRNLNGAGSWLVTAGEMRRGVDVLLIDLPGVVSPAMGAAFLIASLIRIPAAPQAVDVEGTRRVMAHLDKARAERPQGPPQALLVPVRVRELERGLVPWQDLLEPLALPMTPPIRHQVAFDRAFE